MNAPKPILGTSDYFSPTALMNMATIIRLMDAGASYEDAYAHLWNKQTKRGRLPEQHHKQDYSNSKQAQVERLLLANPGMTMTGLEEATGFARATIENVLHVLQQAGRVRRVRGRRHVVDPNRYYPMQVAAE